MARARNIKPGFYTNDTLAEVEPLGRILFTGLWTIADREGRLEDRPRRIKAEILPYDDTDADGLLNQLAEKGFILRYSVGGERFIQVLNFNKHQNPHVKESASEIPEPDLTGTSTVQEPDKNNENTADSLNRIPDTPNRIPESKSTRASSVNDRFDEFWSAYPKKVDKERSRKAFSRIRWREVKFSDLMLALEQHKRSAQWTKDNGEFIPNPTTWINNSRWTVDLNPAVPPNPDPQGYSRDPDEAERKLQRDLEDLQRKALGGSEGQIISLRRGA